MRRGLSLSVFFLFLGILFFTACSEQTTPPEPYGAIPTKNQIEWQKLEYYMFVHFGPNTFTDVEWGDGKEEPKVFNPTALDCRQWAATAKAAGMKAIILTAKHHDGFCLWPSQYSTHTVRESAWKDGKGDVLKELSEACKEYGLKLGVYLSPWDRNHPSYGTPEYNQIFSNTLNEVLSNYGEIFEQWLDGANGEDPKERKQVYDWDLFHATIYRNQPQTIIFSDVGPGCRWMGNENGVAGETNWATLNVEGFAPGWDAPPTEILNKGEEGGKAWVPAETDVSIRPGWFYSVSKDKEVKSLAELVDIYYTSVGRNSNLLLNVPPDHRGLIHPDDSMQLMELRRVIDETFAVNLAKRARFTANHTRGQSSKYSAKNLGDGKFNTYWATDDQQLSASIQIDFGKAQTFNRLVLQEYIPLGQRVKSFSVEYWDGNAWQHLTRQSTIGYKRILCFPTITTQKIQIHIEESLACPVLNEIGVYKAPETEGSTHASGFKTLKPDDSSLWNSTKNVAVSTDSFTLMGKSAMLNSLFSCKNFELEFECKTDSGAIGALFFHSDESLKKGYEVLLNNNKEPLEWRKSGSLSTVRNFAKRMASNNVWIPLKIRVTGKQIQVYVNDVLITDYTEPEHPYRETAYANRLLSNGCFVFFNYSDARISFRNIRLCSLPDNAQSATEGIDETTDAIIRLQQRNFPTIDYHLHLKGKWTVEQAAAQSRKYGITYGIAPNCGKNFPITDDAGIIQWLDTMKNLPFFLPMQAEGREWTGMFSPEAIARFDYRFTDAMTWTDHKGRRMRLWIPEETFIDDTQSFMDMLVDRACQIISNEPIDIYVNPTFIPDELMPEYDALWTPRRMQRIINACVQNQVAIEINNRYRLPSPAFIRLAKSSGAKFTFGTNNTSEEDVGKMEYAIEMIKECNLRVADLYIP